MAVRFSIFMYNNNYLQDSVMADTDEKMKDQQSSQTDGAPKEAKAAAEAQNQAGEKKQNNEAEKNATGDKKETAAEKKPAPKTELELAKEKIEALEKNVEALTKDRDSYKDQVLRRAADFDNYRKRTLQEKQEAIDYANANLLKDLLDSLDNFDRTLDAGEKATDVKSVVDGVKIISKSLSSMLENKYGLVPYGAAGDAFNPDDHEAIGSVQGPVAEPVLKEVYLKGYKLKNRVIRHAKVMVTMPDGTVKGKPEAADAKAEEAKADADKK
jgi:molecular chaperone GrpE